jgi:hypothetical protein
MKCPICDVEVQTIFWRAHREASHQDYVQWGRHKLRLTIYVIIPSWFALIVVDELFGRFLAPDFLFLGVVTYAIVAYASGTLIVVYLIESRKIRELRASWKETHPSP